MKQNKAKAKQNRAARNEAEQNEADEREAKRSKAKQRQTERSNAKQKGGTRFAFQFRNVCYTIAYDSFLTEKAALPVPCRIRFIKHVFSIGF